MSAGSNNWIDYKEGNKMSERKISKKITRERNARVSPRFATSLFSSRNLRTSGRAACASRMTGGIRLMRYCKVRRKQRETQQSPRTMEWAKGNLNLNWLKTGHYLRSIYTCRTSGIVPAPVAGFMQLRSNHASALEHSYKRGG